MKDNKWVWLAARLRRFPICLAISVNPTSHREAILLVSLGSARRWRSRQERTPSYMLVEQAAANVVGFRRLIAAAVPSPPHFVDHSGDRWAALSRQPRLYCFRGLNCTFGFLGVRSCWLRQRRADPKLTSRIASRWGRFAAKNHVEDSVCRSMLSQATIYADGAPFLRLRPAKTG